MTFEYLPIPWSGTYEDSRLYYFFAIKMEVIIWISQNGVRVSSTIFVARYGCLMESINLRPVCHHHSPHILQHVSLVSSTIARLVLFARSREKRTRESSVTLRDRLDRASIVHDRQLVGSLWSPWDLFVVYLRLDRARIMKRDEALPKEELHEDAWLVVGKENSIKFGGNPRTKRSEDDRLRSWQIFNDPV